MATPRAFYDADTDTVYVQRGSSDFVVVSADGDPTIVFNLPGAAAPLISEDDIDTEDAYQQGYEAGESEGYDSGYDDGKAEGYDIDDLDDEYQRGYDDGFDAGVQSVSSESE